MSSSSLSKVGTMALDFLDLGWQQSNTTTSRGITEEWALRTPPTRKKLKISTVCFLLDRREDAPHSPYAASDHKVHGMVLLSFELTHKKIRQRMLSSILIKTGTKVISQGIFSKALKSELNKAMTQYRFCNRWFLTGFTELRTSEIIAERQYLFLSVFKC